MFAKNKLGASPPLILENVEIPLNHGLAIEEVFEDNFTTSSLLSGNFVKIEEVFSDPEEDDDLDKKIRQSSWRNIPIVIEEVKVKKLSWMSRWNRKACLGYCFFYSTLMPTDHYFFKVHLMLKK